jgi:hypothetical protein
MTRASNLEGRRPLGFHVPGVSTFQTKWQKKANLAPPRSAIGLPYRQFVFSIPILLRVYFKYGRGLLTEFCYCARESLEFFFRTVLGFRTEFQAL